MDFFTIYGIIEFRFLQYMYIGFAAYRKPA